MIYECLLALNELSEEEILEYKRLLDLVKEDNNAPSYNPNNSENILIQVEKSQERMLLSLEENNVLNARKMTVFQIEVALEKFDEAMSKLKMQEDVTE